MIYIPGENPEFNVDLRRVISDSNTEATSGGFVYYVASPEEKIGLSMGQVYRTPQQSDVTLIINGNVEPEIRQKVAEITVHGEEHIENGRYWLTNALNDVLRFDSNEAFAENVMCVAAVNQALLADLASIRANPDLHPMQKQRLILEAKSALGWTAVFRGTSDIAHETWNDFTRLGLWIPDSTKHDVEMSGFMITKKGTVRAGFKSMPEHSERHTCACCSAQILKNTNRMSVSLDQNDGYSNHHHYHYNCFYESVLPKFLLDTIEEVPIKLG